MLKKLVVKNNNLIEDLKNRFKNCSDFVCQKIICNNSKLEVYKLYINQLVDMELVDVGVLKPLTNLIPNISNSKELENCIKSGEIYHIDIKIKTNIEKIVAKLLDANFVLVCEEQAYIFDTKGYSKRTIEEPESETVVKGAKEGFIESRATNISLLRRRIQTTKLKVLDKDIGSETSTKLAIMYIDGTANENILNNIVNKIDNIEIPSLVSLSNFEEQIIGRKFSIFPQLIATERVDKVAANLIEGRIVILIDGFPTAYILPVSLPMFMQAPEEYNINYFVSSFIRMLRYVAGILAILLPALYIAIATFHQEMIPTTLAKSIIASKQDVPLPTFLEVIIMLISFEILLEAGARMPKTAGQTVSIVGALIVGDAAVNAKFVSPAVVVIVAIAAISGFVIPNQDMSNAVRISRFGFVIVSSIAGLYGMSLATIAVIYYLCSIDSFSMPYLKPFVANNGKDIMADTLVRGIIHKSKKKMARW